VSKLLLARFETHSNLSTQIEKDLGFFLTSELLTLDLGKKVSERIRELCKRLAPHALPLVNAYGIPPQLMNVPIATDWVKFNK